MYLPDTTRYDEIKREVLYMYEECKVCTYPINCFEIAKKLCYILVPYSQLTDQQLKLAKEYSPDGFSLLRKMPDTGMFRWYIFYNDYTCYERQRWTILHEIGHIYLGHLEPDCQLSPVEKEAEANFFAKYSIAPPPLIYFTNCSCPMDVAKRFHVSNQASIYLFDYYQKWLQSGPKRYEQFEFAMIVRFLPA